MSFLGKGNVYGLFEKQVLSPDGITNTFSLKFKVAQSTSLLVVKNGDVLEGGSDYSIAGNQQGQIFFTELPLSTDKIFIIFLGRELSVAKTVGSEPIYRTFVGDGITTSFNPNVGAIIPDALIVFIDRVQQRLVDDYTVNGNSVVFNDAPSNGSIVDLYIHGIERLDSGALKGWSVDSNDNLIPNAPNQSVGAPGAAIGDLHVGGNSILHGNLTVLGTTVTLDSEDLLVKDNKITLNSNFDSGTPVLNIGIEGKRGDEPSAKLRWNESLQHFEAGIEGNIKRLALTGESIESLNGSSEVIQSFETGTSGSDFNISTTGGAHRFNIPDASPTTRGLINNSNQTIGGWKTFNDDVTIDGALLADGQNLTNVITINDSEIETNFTEKVTPVEDDVVLIEDSEDGFSKKKVKLANMISSDGILSLNNLTDAEQFFDFTSNSGSMGFSSVGDTHTLNIPLASIDSNGLLSTSSQTIAGNKSFTGSVTATTFNGSGSNLTGVITTGSNNISPITAKTTLVNNDVLLIEDSADSLSKKSVTFQNFYNSLPIATGSFPGFLSNTDQTIGGNKTFLGNISTSGSISGSGTNITGVFHQGTSGEINSLASKVTPSSSDILLLESVADSFAKRKVSIGSLLFDGTQISTGTISVNRLTNNLVYSNGTVTLGWAGSTRLTFTGNFINPSHLTVNLGSNTNSFNGIYVRDISSNTGANLRLFGGDIGSTGTEIHLYSGSSHFWTMGTTGIFTPTANNISDLGTSFWRIKEIFSVNPLNVSSDIRLKNIEKYLDDTDSLSKILELETFEYKYINEFDSSETLRVGVSAQGCYNLFPAVVVPGDNDLDKNINDDGFEMWSIRSEYLIPYLISAIKQLKKELDELK